MSRDYIQRSGLLSRARIWTYFFWSSHLTFSWEASGCRREWNPEQKWHWQNSETEGSVEVCTNFLESSTLPQMKYLPLQPLIYSQGIQEQISQVTWTHHREDKDLMAWASSPKDTLPKSPNPLLVLECLPHLFFHSFSALINPYILLPSSWIMFREVKTGLGCVPGRLMKSEGGS